jgi:N-acetylglucosaminyldiphosphoundecaprenol N-acetyl-beta-D-mannosaminyltransferase
MSNKNKIKNLFFKITPVKSGSDIKNIFLNLDPVSRPKILAFLNAHAVNLAAEDSAFYRQILSCDVLLRDGIGVKIGLSIFSISSGLNMNGTDFIPKVLEVYKGRRIAFYGTKEPYLQDSVEWAESKSLKVVSSIDGFQSEQFYIDDLNKTLPDIIVLGMGMPKQEFLANRIRQECTSPMIIICGGAVLDFKAERFLRAPKWMRYLAIEWVFRLFMEPARMWKRYLLGNFKYLFRVIVSRFKKD